MDKLELEDQFILRLPINEANYVRELLATKPKRLKKQLRLQLDAEKGEGIVSVRGTQLRGRLKKFPTVLESMKTCNGSIFTKTADVCQMLDCCAPEETAYPHGYTPPLKNVRKNRFRKNLVNKDEDAVNIQKELYYLLQADLSAVSSRFELIYDENNNNQRANQTEIEIFGNVLTDSDDTDSNIEDIPM